MSDGAPYGPSARREFIYVWANNTKRRTLKGRRCRVISMGRMNSRLVEFFDTGQREIVSCRALREIR